MSVDLGNGESRRVSATAAIEQIPGEPGHHVMLANTNNRVPIDASVAEAVCDGSPRDKFMRRSENELAFCGQFCGHSSDLQEFRVSNPSQVTLCHMSIVRPTADKVKRVRARIRQDFENIVRSAAIT
jgi:hypothetical protein